VQCQHDVNGQLTRIEFDMGKYAPNVRNNSQVSYRAMDTSAFLQTHRVFNLEEAVQALAPAGARNATLERLKYAVGRGKLIVRVCRQTAGRLNGPS